MLNESDIVWDDNAFVWVHRDSRRKRYTVLLYNWTHSREDSAFALDADGLSLAIARADCLSKRACEKHGVPQNTVTLAPWVAA